MKYLLLFGGFFIYGYGNSQTCIIVVKTKDKIYVGADSRVTRYNTKLHNNKISTDTIIEKVCKIYHCGKTFFSFGGWVNEDVEACLKNVCLKDTTLSGKAMIFVKDGIQVIKDAAIKIKLVDPTQYQDIIN